MNSARVRLVLASILALAFPLVSSAQSPELRALQAQYKNDLIDKVTDIYNGAVWKLDEGYLAALDTSFGETTAAGDLEGALSLEAEKKRIANKEPLPVSDAQAHKALRKLRGIYRVELAKLDAQRAANHTAILTAHLAKLKQLEIDLTKATRLADAKAVMDYRQALASGVPIKEAVATTTSPSAPAIPFGARLAANMKIYASGNNNCTVTINGKELMKVKRETADVVSLHVSEGDVIAIKISDRFSDSCFWLSAIASSGEFLFETSEEWTGYLPEDEVKWWDIKTVKEKKPAEFAKFSSEYIGLIKKAASATPFYNGTQPIHSLLDGTRRSYFYYVVTRADLVPKKERKQPEAAPKPDDKLLADLIGTWRMTWDKNGWNTQRTFKAEGTFTGLWDDRQTHEAGTWQAVGDQIILNHDSGSREVMFLPLNRKGTKVVQDRKGRELVAVKERDLAAEVPAKETVAPSQSTAGLPPSGDIKDAIPANAIIIEALIDGPSELRVKKDSLYWINIRNSKPGRHLGTKEPTYINGQSWLPQWKDEIKKDGADQSSVQAISPIMDISALQFKLISVKSKRGETGIDKRDEIKLKLVNDELSVLIPDSQGGSKWYRFALIPKQG